MIMQMHPEKFRDLRRQIGLDDIPWRVLRVEEDVIVFGDPQEGWYEWGVFKGETLSANSFAQYGCIASALRDGLLYAETGMVLIGGTTKGEAFELAPPPDWMAVRVYQPSL